MRVSLVGVYDAFTANHLPECLCIFSPMTGRVEVELFPVEQKFLNYCIV